MKKICIVTGTRSEYGLLYPLIKKLNQSTEFDVHLAVTGMHLSKEYGNTIDYIKEDGLKIDEEIAILSGDNTPVGITKTMGTALEKFGKYFYQLSPDMLIILGDRYEIFSVAAAAAVLNIPIAHLHGGEITLGAYDEFFRHSITKMSCIHFTSCAEHRKRVIQLGEAPETVFNVGAIGIENIKSMRLLSKDELENSLQFSLKKEFSLVTFHPVTLEKQSIEEQCQALLNAIAKTKDMSFVITKANADDGGKLINEMLENFAAMYPEKILLHSSLGQLRYLSAMKYCSFVLGNSSSGLIEAPSFHVPTINIGNRQKGRVRGKTVIDCIASEEDILNAISKARDTNFRQAILTECNPYGDGNVSDKIVEKISQYFSTHHHGINKEFYDINFEVNE